MKEGKPGTQAQEREEEPEFRMKNGHNANKWK